MKKFSSLDISVNELNINALKKRATIIASEINEPVIVLFRELISSVYNESVTEQFVLYLHSNLDSCFVRLKHFQSLDNFILWYLGKHPYKDFTFLNYTEI